MWYLFAIAFLANNLMDEIAHHVNNSMLLNWFKRYPKFHKWLKSDWREQPDYKWYDLRQMYMDGWHFFKSVMFISFDIVFFSIDWKAGIVFLICWAVFFTLPRKLLDLHTRK